MTPRWQPYREPIRTTILRTGLIAIVVGGVLAQFWGGLFRWPTATLLVLWPSFGGHWVEILFLNRLRPRLSSARGAQIAGRLAVWFVGGTVLAIGMFFTAKGRPGLGRVDWPNLTACGGFGFVAIELTIHLVLQLRGLDSFYNGRG